MTEDNIPGTDQKQSLLNLLPRYVKNFPKRNYIVWIFARYMYERVEDKKRRHFAMIRRHFPMAM